MKKVVVLVALLVMLPAVTAQLSWSITDLRCGNGILDEFELCEKGVEESRCDQIAEKMGIDMGCYEQHCTCVPRVNPTYCGNDRRDFNEMCDGSDPEDMCPVLGEIMGNLTLTCNKSTCGCDIAAVPQDYNPTYLDKLSNISETPSSCGDKKVERDEDCDPPNTLCTVNTGNPGVCTDKCKCVAPEMLDVPEEKEQPAVEENATMNATVESAGENETGEPSEMSEETAEKKPGFFGRIWAWIKGLFS